MLPFRWPSKGVSYLNRGLSPIPLKIFLIISLILFIFPGIALAVDVAPRISDREIIEKLAALEAGQAALGKRIDDLNVRMTSLENTMLTIFSAMVALIIALFAYIAWDRRTMLKPLVDRLDSLGTGTK